VTVVNKAIAGMRWGAFARIINQGLSWVATIWVIRLLTPEDFALIALSDLAIGALLIIGQFGIGAALIRTIELTKKQINQSFTTLFIANLFLFLLFQFSAPYIANFFEQPKLLLLIRLSAISFLFVPFMAVNSALVHRNMQYKQLYMFDMGIGLLQIITNLLLAMQGYGFWALAVGSLVAQFARVLSYNWITKYCPQLDFSFSEFKPLLRDSALNFFNATGWEINQRLDTFFINLFIGSNALGLYRVVLSLAEKPVTVMGQLVQQIGLASFSKVSKNITLVGTYVVKSTSVLAIVLFPVFFGIAAIAPNFVPLLLGDKWLEAIVPLQIICAIQLVNALRVIPGSALFATGYGKRKILHMSVAIVASLIGWGVGLQHGLNIGCLLFAITYIIWFIWHIYDASSRILIDQSKYWRCLSIPLFMSVIMFFAVMAIGNIMNESSIVIVLIAQIFVGGLTYVLLSVTVFKKYVLTLISLLKNKN
jgi:teichuronic acid exporter